jgi:hypothetical protein
MCSLEEAFNGLAGEEPRLFEPAPPTGGEERRKRKKRRPLLPPEPVIIEPDRPAHRVAPQGELLEGSAETATSALLNARDVAQSQYAPAPSIDVNDATYNLEPDWTKVFNDTSAPDWIKERMPRRDAETPLVPSPWIDGAPTLWQTVPDSLRTQIGGAPESTEQRLNSLQSRLDSMFAKLDSVETARAENNHVEILLFVLGGLFLLLLLDILVKQGTRAAFMVATAGGAIAMQKGLAFV